MSTLQQEKRFLNLDFKVQTIIIELARSPHNFDALKSLIQVQSQSIKGHITNELLQQRGDLAQEHYRQGLLKSLWFPEIYKRQETVSEAHGKTFQWVFEPNGFDKSARRWHNFVQWLEKGDGIYWINGKAGSGKSTLMNYIHQDHRTSDLLRVWSDAKEVVILNFFFWNAGTTLEKTSEGLLRSLLYQILQKLPILIRSTFDNQQKSDTFAAWTKRRLYAAFSETMLQAQVYSRICIFIDGLDETSDDADGLIAVIENILSTNVKICLSSRPERLYAEAFDTCPKLRLQDLTEPDIRIYVRDKLRPLLRKGSENEVSRLLDNVVWKAQGIFLWVRLVVIALIKGVQNEDCLEQLQIRVELLPSDMEGLYAGMLSNIEVAYQEEAAQVFQMALTNLTQSLLDVTLAMCRGFDHMAELSVQELLRLSLRYQKRIPAICAGLLEVHLEDRDSEEGGGSSWSLHYPITLPYHYNDSPDTAQISYYERYAHVAFIHRTAIDFLRQSRQGQAFLEKNTKSGFNPHSAYVRALLAKATVLGLPEKSNETVSAFESGFIIPVGFSIDDCCYNFEYNIARFFVHDMMHNLMLAEWKSATAQMALCDDVDRTLASLYQRNCVAPPLSHWCTYWGISVPETCGTSSRPSSPMSFYSARSEPVLLSSGPVDFLGFAAYWGLPRYVLQVFDLQRNGLDDPYIDYLLFCSTNAVRRALHCATTNTEWVSQSLKLTEGLLSRGGKPNAYAEGFSTTIWGSFLNLGNLLARDSTNRAFHATVQAFLDAGADAHAKLRTRYHAGGIYLDSAPVNFDDGRIVRFDLEVSALTLVRSYSKYAPEWKPVDEIILVKGGYEFHKYTHVDVYRKDHLQPYEISEKQHEILIAALNESHDQYADQLSPDTEWRPVMVKICNEHLANIEDLDGPTSPDDFVSSDADAEEGYYEPYDIQPEEDAQDSRPIG